MTWSLTTLLGLVAAAMTTAANVPQVWKAWRTKQTDDLSLAMTLILSTGLGLWVIYGIMQSDLVIVLANAVAMVLSTTLAVMKMRFG
jgi:MtN3 and saliva related transmembrane protein